MSDKNGVIYILTNPSFPDYVKIGYADDIEKRLKQLNRSECIPFYIYGRSKGYRIYIIAPKAETLADAEIAQLIQNMDIKIDSSWPKEIPITVTRNERVHEVEDNIIKLGQLVYNEWKKKA